MFTIIEGAFIITRSKGIYRQQKLYERAERIYAQWSNGYVTINKNAGKIATSLPDVLVDEIVNLDDYKFTKTGQLVREAFVENYQSAKDVMDSVHGKK